MKEHSVRQIRILSVSKTKEVSGALTQDYYVYWIEVTTDKLTYKICRRYSEFLDLYKHLKRYRNLRYNNFPKKTYFSLKQDAKLENRLKKLDTFLDYLLGQVNRGAIIDELFHFLEVPKHQR